MHRLSIPSQIALVYLCVICIGCILLYSPAASGPDFTFFDSIFMATSGLTVTGLSVIDVGSEFTFFGQFVLLLLIQLGGLGLMTIAVIVMMSLGHVIGIQQQTYVQEELGFNSRRGVLKIAWLLLKVSLFCEAIGAIILAFTFVPEFGWGTGIWYSIFHAISAFNNAGFSLFSDSLGGYAHNPFVTVTVSILFIIGGLGVVVISDLGNFKRRKKLSLHTYLMLYGTLFLIVTSLMLYGLIEWRNPETLGQFDGVGTKLNVLWFEAVTPRTAGFNIVPTDGVKESISLLLMVLMIIGGGASSTAGGIKVTTAALLVLATIAFFRKSGTQNAFGYHVSLETNLKVMAILTVFALIFTLGTFILLATHPFSFQDAAFEVVSALGTVGLSRGITADLNGAGEILICVIMFLGRIGPLSIGFFIASQSISRVTHPEGKVFLG